MYEFIPSCLTTGMNSYIYIYYTFIVSFFVLLSFSSMNSALAANAPPPNGPLLKPLQCNPSVIQCANVYLWGIWLLECV